MANNYHSTPHMPDQADLDRQAARSLEEQQKKLLSTISVKTEDGKARLFGVEIPESIAPALNMALGTLLIPISKGVSGFVYNQTKSLTQSTMLSGQIAKIGGNPAKIALVAELTAMWGLFAARPIAEFVSANKRYATARMELSKDIKSACESTGADYQHNKVIATAYRELHDNWMNDLKLIVPSLLSIVPHVTYGLKLHNDILSKRSVDVEASTRIVKATTAEPHKTPEQHHQQIVLERAQALEQVRKKEYAEFRTRNGIPESNDSYKRFKEEYWDEVAASLKPAESTPHGKGKVASEGMQDMVNFTTFAGIASMLGEGIGVSMRKAQKEQGKKSTSWNLIKQLEKQMQGKQSVESVHHAVVDIFQALEEDVGGTKFSGGLLEKLKEATKPVAQYIANGRLDADSLLKLVGEDKIIEHGVGGGRSFRHEKEILKSMQEAISEQVNEAKEISAEQLLGGIANPLLAKETIKKNLETMAQGPEKDFFISVMPIEILEQAGMKDKDIREHRHRAHVHLYDQVASSVIHIAALDPESLKKYGVAEKEITAVKALSQKIMSGDMEALEVAVDSKNQVMSTVATVELGEQMDGKATVWAERVEEAKSLDARIAEIKAEKCPPKEKEHEPHAEHHARHEKRHDGHVDRHQHSTSIDPSLSI